MPRKTPLYEFTVTWQYLKGSDPDKVLRTAVFALSVPHALTRFYRERIEEGYGKSRQGFHILEIANESI